MLPDLFIGAHAAVAGLPMLTCDPRRYQSYFNGLQFRRAHLDGGLIEPDPGDITGNMAP